MSDFHGTEDGTHREARTFEALPPARGRGFARTWWGHAWLQALEDTALDGQQVKLGRRHARAGAVGAVSVRPGRLTAVVRDRDGTAHRADVLLQELRAADWDRLLDMVADRAGHLAALLDRDMPPQLVEDAAAAGVELLPGIGDLEPSCGCEAWDHCAHTAALCYQMARLLDQDPFVLLLLRGRGEEELLGELQARSAARAQAYAPEPEADGESGLVPVAGAGVLAAEAFAAGQEPAPLPAPPPRVDEAGAAPALGGGAPPGPGVDIAALEFLIRDSAERAGRQLAEALSPWHADTPPTPGPTLSEDAVRMAAAGPPAAVAGRLAAGSGRDAKGLAAAVRAWRQGGPAGLAVLEKEWTPGAEELARATAGLAASWADDADRPRMRVTRNRWTVVGTGAQLRLDREGRWWPYRKERGHWLPSGPPDEDPAAALASATGTAEAAETDQG
ncbi:SWF or SNF family helicase [Streptomyces sp. Ru73]|uniref:SWIM zinc finger family protein n=1 Tax=Streptomyces sp. Ru73 TaxID=2080748 RepID=UPI000CDD44D5|nr:SWF or SNF family helicase [Streptomyces sp. Ru73]POX38784.1 SWF or SNF family helicase [Streptomyces sp. Ru73]